MWDQVTTEEGSASERPWSEELTAEEMRTRLAGLSVAELADRLGLLHDQVTVVMQPDRLLLRS
jgi:uncharacterized small protein (DUF1192 family)